MIKNGYIYIKETNKKTGVKGVLRYKIKMDKGN